MEVIRIEQADLIGRLDAEYYQQKFVDADRRVRNFRPNLPIEKIWREHNRIYIGIAGFDFIDDPTHFTPFLRPVDIGLDGEIDYSSLPWCKKEWLEDHEGKGCGQPSDLIVEVKGNTRKVAVLDKRIPGKCIVSGSSYRIKLREGHDPHFVQAYLLSPTGQLLKRRLVSNTAVSYVDPASFRKMRIPTPSFDVQSYIGDKVRQAEALRSWARGVRTAVNAEFGNVPKPALSWRTSFEDFDSYRMNPKHYDPLILGAISDMKNSHGTMTLGEVVGDRRIAGGATPLGAVYEAGGIHFLRVQNVKEWGLNHADAVFISDETDEAIARSRCGVDDVVLTITGYPGTAALVTEADLPANINQHSVRFGVRDGWPVGFVVAAINSRFVQLQVARLAIGGTRDALDYPSVAALHLPNLDAVVMQRIDKYVRRVITAEQAVHTVTTAARLLVEALIERKVTEAELVAAHKEPDADRALLERLSADGLDITEADPLFPDLDKLEELLKEAQQGNDE